MAREPGWSERGTLSHLGCKASQNHSCGVQLCYWLIKQEVSYVGGERGIHGGFGYKGLQLPSNMKLSGNL